MQWGYIEATKNELHQMETKQVHKQNGEGVADCAPTTDGTLVE